MNEQEQTIDLKILVRIFLKHIIPILIVAIIGAGAGFALAGFVIPKRYSSTALMYVENSSNKKDESTINYNDLTAAQKLVNTCQILFTSNSVLQKLSSDIGEKYLPKELEDMIKIESVNSTEVLRITVTSSDPDDAKAIAEHLIALSTEEFIRVIKGGSLDTFDPPGEADKTFPSVFRFTLIGGLIGLFGSYLIFFIAELVDNKVKPDDDLAQIYDIPVFAEILDFETASKGGKHGYGKYEYESYAGEAQEKERSYPDDEDDEYDSKNNKKGRLRNA